MQGQDSSKCAVTHEELLVLQRVSITGYCSTAPSLPWPAMKELLSRRLTEVVRRFQSEDKQRAAAAAMQSDAVTAVIHAGLSSVDDRTQSLLFDLQELEWPPFTLQRLCEILLHPHANYRFLYKLLNGIEKLLHVVERQPLQLHSSTIAEDSQSLVYDSDSHTLRCPPTPELTPEQLAGPPRVPKHTTDATSTLPTTSAFRAEHTDYSTEHSSANETIHFEDHQLDSDLSREEFENTEPTASAAIRARNAIRMLTEPNGTDRVNSLSTGQHTLEQNGFVPPSSFGLEEGQDSDLAVLSPGRSTTASRAVTSVSNSTEHVANRLDETLDTANSSPRQNGFMADPNTALLNSALSRGNDTSPRTIVKSWRRPRENSEDDEALLLSVRDGTSHSSPSSTSMLPADTAAASHNSDHVSAFTEPMKNDTLSSHTTRMNSVKPLANSSLANDEPAVSGIPSSSSTTSHSPDVTTAIRDESVPQKRMRTS